MKPQDNSLVEDGPKVAKSKETEKVGRRSFIGAASAAGIVGAAEILRSTHSQAQGTPQISPSIPRLSSIEKVTVSKEEALDIPGGKEHFYEWQASDDQGITSKFLVHGWRTESGETYTVTTDVTVHRFAAGADLANAPHASSSQRIVVFGTKGPITGSIRRDHVVTTTVNADGTTNRSEQFAQVRLDLAEVFPQDLKTIATNAGRRWLGKR